MADLSNAQLAGLIDLLQQLLAAHQRLLGLALARQNAMQTCDLGRLNDLLERERPEVQALERLEKQRKYLLHQLRIAAGPGQLGANPSITEIAERSPEPVRSELLGLAGKLKTVLTELGRVNRMNAKVSQGVTTGLAKVLGALTGLAQHAGLYLANGRKAVIKGVHLLDALA